MAENILEVKNLKKYFKTHKGNVHAVDNVSFTLERGKTLGIVGESGCGKSTTGRTILRLIEPTSGEVYFEGRDISKLSGKEMTKLRKDMQIIFQDPFSSLDPRMTVSQLIAEPLKYHPILKTKSGKALEKETEETTQKNTGSADIWKLCTIVLAGGLGIGAVVVYLKYGRKKEDGFVNEQLEFTDGPFINEEQENEDGQED